MNCVKFGRHLVHTEEDWITYLNQVGDFVASPVSPVSKTEYLDWSFLHVILLTSKTTFRYYKYICKWISWWKQESLGFRSHGGLGGRRNGAVEEGPQDALLADSAITLNASSGCDVLGFAAVHLSSFVFISKQVSNWVSPGLQLLAEEGWTSIANADYF